MDEQNIKLTKLTKCAGCGAKVGAGVLSQLLEGIRVHHDPNLLVTAWFNLMGRNLRKRKPTQERFEPLVTAPFVSVSSRVSHMLRGLLKGTLQKMNQLFNPEDSRSTHVATFLALLELIRAGRIKVEDEGQLNLDRTHRRNKEASAHE